MSTSIRRRLLIMLTLAVLAAAEIAAIASYFIAWRSAHVLQDDVLFQVSDLIDKQRMVFGPHAGTLQLEDEDNDSFLLVQSIDNSKQGDTTNDLLPLPANWNDGWHSLETPHGDYRVLITDTSAGERIAVAQASSFRDRIAMASSALTVVPLLLLIPALMILIIILVRRATRPLRQLANVIDNRSEHDLAPLADTDVPDEVLPFVSAINRLLGRVGQSVDDQRRFIANAAHELRTPLTALSLQADRLGQAEMSVQARERLATLQNGIERERNLVHQLLSLSHAQLQTDMATTALSMHGIYRRILQDLMPLAESRRIDVGVTDEHDIAVRIPELDLLMLVRNLIDNAIRYTPTGGRVDVSTEALDDSVLIRVADSGPGIAPAERAHLLEPFQRLHVSDGKGSGLGLSIVQAIVTRLHGTLDLAYADPSIPQGLAVTVTLPTAT